MSLHQSTHNVHPQLHLLTCVPLPHRRGNIMMCTFCHVYSMACVHACSLLIVISTISAPLKLLGDALKPSVAIRSRESIFICFAASKLSWSTALLAVIVTAHKQTIYMYRIHRNDLNDRISFTDVFA